ncbi:unnamed protein product [Diplocarpon coronariae]
MSRFEPFTGANRIIIFCGVGENIFLELLGGVQFPTSGSGKLAEKRLMSGIYGASMAKLWLRQMIEANMGETDI